MPKQYVHRKKPGGSKPLTVDKWLTLDLAATSATGAGLLVHKLYSRIEWESLSEQSPGFRVVYRLVRKKQGKWKLADPTAYDERTVLNDSQKFAQHSIEYVGPVRKGETGRPYYWQVKIIPARKPEDNPVKPSITTRYSDFWRVV